MSAVTRSPAAATARTPLVLRRTLAAPLLPASLLLAVLTSVVVTTALASFGSRALPVAAHKRLASSRAATVQVSGQIDAARARADLPVLRSAMRSALGTIPFSILSARWFDQLALPAQSGLNKTALIQAAALDGVRQHVVLTAGAWPAGQRPGAAPGVLLPATTASLLHIPVGQELALRDSVTGSLVRLRVTGLYRPADPAASYWRLSLLGTSGRYTQGNFVTYGPMLTGQAGELPVSEASWLVSVNTARIAPGAIAGVAQRLATAVGDLQGRQDLGGPQLSTNLPQTLSALASSLVVARSLLLIGSLQLLLLAGAAATLAARLLAAQREEETALLSARGVARAQLVRASLAEAAVIAVIGAAAGFVAGSYLANALMSANGLPSGLPSEPFAAVRGAISSNAWWPAAAITLGVIAVTIWPALRPASPVDARRRRGRQAALATAAGAGLDLALIALGALAFWELHRYSAAPRLNGGSLGIDPVLAVAPALALAGVALLPLRALPAAARLLDRLSAHRRRLTGALASWQLSRRPVRVGSPVLLVVLAVATGTLLLAQRESWRQSQLDQAAFSTGADVRVSLAGPLPLGSGSAFSHARGVQDAMPVASYTSGYTVLAVGSAQAPRTVLMRPDLSAIPLAGLWKLITPRGPGPGLPLPGTPARLGITASLAIPPGSQVSAASATLSVEDGSGIVYQVPAGTLPADSRDHVLAAALSPARRARYPLRLLGISLSYQMPGLPVPPYLGLAARLAGARAERRAADRATVNVRGLAISERASGSFAAPFAGGAAFTRWDATAGSADLANPLATGIRPSVAGRSTGAGGAAVTFRIGAGHLIQKAGSGPLPIAGQVELTAGAPALPVPAIATRAFFSAANASPGGVIPLGVGNVSVPVRLAAEVRAFPTVGAGPALILDQGWLQQALAAQSQPALPVTQWWLTTAHGATPAGLPGGASTTTVSGASAALLGDPLPNVPQLSLLVIVAAAAVLAGIGFVVSVVAAVRERRVQDALLAALGVGSGARTWQLCLEQLMLSLPGAAAGAAIGAALAHLLVPAVTVTAGGAAPFPPVHVVIPLAWTVLLAAGIAAVPVLAAAAAGAYRPDPAAQLRVGESA